MKINHFNFREFHGKYLLTNDFGSYTFLAATEFKQLISRNVVQGSALWERLEKGNFIYADSTLNFSATKQYDLREIKGYVGSAASLHIFVVTTACNMNCIYCQANNGYHRPHQFMNTDTAEKAVKIALQSPVPHLSFEFQGGEPLLNFPIITHIVETAEKLKGSKVIDYNVVTNLTLLTDEMLTFFTEHHFGISTSIDGTRLVHEHNRPFLDGTSTYDKVLDSVHKVRQAGIPIGAIQTTTAFSLEYPEEIVRAYVSLGFDSIFLRPLTPLGKATKNWNEIGYTPAAFLAFYRRAFAEILAVNQGGVFFKEAHAEIFLRKIQGQPVNYMELRSPCGAGIGQLAYFPDGNIFTCDEGRMLYEMGDDVFCIGNVQNACYSEMIQSSKCRAICTSSILEALPSCCDCIYQPYCGTCPVVNYAQHADLIEKQSGNYRCRIYSGMLDTLFEKFLENDSEIVETILSWGH